MVTAIEILTGKVGGKGNKGAAEGVCNNLSVVSVLRTRVSIRVVSAALIPVRALSGVRQFCTCSSAADSSLYVSSHVICHPDLATLYNWSAPETEMVTGYHLLID